MDRVVWIDGFDTRVFAGWKSAEFVEKQTSEARSCSSSSYLHWGCRRDFLHSQLDWSSKGSSVHGDIKPENILFNNELHCKLADFGDARLSAYTCKNLAAAGPGGKDQATTPVYAAPERLSLDPVDPRRDQDTYSFGLIIYTVLTAVAPFARRVSVETYLQGIKESRRPDTKLIDALRHSMTELLERIIEKMESVMKQCWDHIPSRRSEMIDVRNQLQKLFKRMKQAVILQSVVDVLQMMNINAQPDYGKLPCALLNWFNAKSKPFAPGITNTIDDKMCFSLLDKCLHQTFIVPVSKQVCQMRFKHHSHRTWPAQVGNGNDHFTPWQHRCKCLSKSTVTKRFAAERRRAHG